MASKNGPKPEPSNMKVLKGTERPCRVNKNEPQLPIERSIVPKWLSEQAKEAYLQLSDVLVGMQVLTKADRLALEMLCDAYATYRKATEFVQQNGLTYEMVTKSGDIMHRAYPQVAIASDAYKLVRSLMTEFGLTPASRSKVSAQGEQQKDPLAEYMNG